MVLTYHHIGSEPGFNTVAESSLEEQLQYVRSHYHVLSVEEYVNHIFKFGKAKQGAVLVSFDDAYTSYVERALPVLTKMNLRSVLFICTGVIGKSNEWDSPDKRFSIINEETIKLLSENSLITIGAHTESHRSLTLLGEKDLKDEMTNPKEKLEKLIGKPIDFLAYPYGQLHLNVNSKVKVAAYEAGYKAAFSTNFSIDNSRSNIWALNRIDVTGDDDIETFKSKLKRNSYFSVKQQVKNVYSFLKNAI